MSRGNGKECGASEPIMEGRRKGRKGGKWGSTPRLRCIAWELRTPAFHRYQTFFILANPAPVGMLFLVVPVIPELQIVQFGYPCV